MTPIDAAAILVCSDHRFYSEQLGPFATLFQSKAKFLFKTARNLRFYGLTVTILARRVDCHGDTHLGHVGFVTVTPWRCCGNAHIG